MQINKYQPILITHALAGEFQLNSEHCILNSFKLSWILIISSTKMLQLNKQINVACFLYTYPRNVYTVSREIPEPVVATPTKTSSVMKQPPCTLEIKYCCLWLSLIPYGGQTCPYTGTWRFRFCYCKFLKLLTLMERHKPELHDESLFSGSFSN